jgi:hypothetical protein
MTNPTDGARRELLLIPPWRIPKGYRRAFILVTDSGRCRIEVTEAGIFKQTSGHPPDAAREWLKETLMGVMLECNRLTWEAFE